MTKRSVLILGATGGVGGELAATLHARGWRVAALHRDPDAARARARLPAGITWHGGDAMRAADVAAAADGCAVIVHAVNPPGYRRWNELVLPMIDNTIAAARAQGARILLPGTIYNFGPDASPVLDETTRQDARTRKGAIRIELERRLAASGLSALIVRAGDFFGARAANSWFSQGMVKAGEKVRFIRTPASPGIGHAWAYLPDLAEAMTRLLERGTPPGSGVETFHFGGHWDPDGRALPEAIRRVLRRPAIPVRPFPWTLAYAGAPFVTFLREVIEMRYLWRLPFRLDNRRLVAELGAEPHTPLDEAVGATLRAIGCAA